MDDKKKTPSCSICGKQPAIAVVEGTGAHLCAPCKTAFALGQQSPARRIQMPGRRKTIRAAQQRAEDK